MTTTKPKAAHVWCVESQLPSGRWVFVFAMANREFARKESQWRTSYFDKQFRIRKYTRQSP